MGRGGGFRELCEALEIYLTQVYAAVSVLHASLDGKVSSSAVVGVPKEFDRKGLGTKLTMLKEKFGIEPRSPAHLSTLWDARNCLTHRRGVVSERDCNVSDGLEVKWIGVDFVYVAPDGAEKKVVPGMLVNGGGFEARSIERVRLFKVGERINFSPAELSEICWFTLVQSDSIMVGVLKLAAEKGIGQPETVHATDVDPAAEL